MFIVVLTTMPHFNNLNMIKMESYNWCVKYIILFQHPDVSSCELLPYFQEHTNKYPRIFRLWLGPLLPFVILTHPDTIKMVLQTSEPKYTDYSSVYTLFLPWLGNY